MPKYARIIESTVVETFTPPAGFKLPDCFHPDVAAQFASVPENVEVGWTATAQGWAPPPAPAPSMEPPADAPAS